MAQVTFTTTLGTDIRITNIQSNSSFEILKAAFALIDGIELAEKAGNAAEVLEEGVFTEVGGTSGLFLTSKPQNVVFVDDIENLAEHLAPLAPAVDELSSCDGLDCSCADFDETDEINEAYEDVDAMIDEFLNTVLYTYPEDIPDLIGAFATELRDYADHLDGNPAANSIFSLGAGIEIGAKWMYANWSPAQDQSKAA